MFISIYVSFLVKVTKNATETFRLLRCCVEMSAGVIWSTSPKWFQGTLEGQEGSYRAVFIFKWKQFWRGQHVYIIVLLIG